MLLSMMARVKLKEFKGANLEFLINILTIITEFKKKIYLVTKI
jgi:hypothetical protein